MRNLRCGGLWLAFFVDHRPPDRKHRHPSIWHAAHEPITYSWLCNAKRFGQGRYASGLLDCVLKLLHARNLSLS